jgi:hypothetical protein
MKNEKSFYMKKDNKNPFYMDESTVFPLFLTREVSQDQLS